MISDAIDPKRLVQKYIDQVLSGERVTCAAERAAVDRQIHDLKHAHKRGFFFSEKDAIRSVKFFPACLVHTVGEWAGSAFHLTPWQAFVIWCVMGWRCEGDKSRRFRKAYCTVARKNGKTTLLAGWAALLLYADLINGKIEAGGRGFCAATKQPQASLLWDETKRMIEASPVLLKRCKITKSKQLLTLPKDPYFGAEFRPVGADGTRQDGLNPTFVIKDELHAWRNTKAMRDLDEKLSTGGASRLSPLEIIITTAGDDDSEIWQETHEHAETCVLMGAKGNVVDDSLFALICQAEEQDDPLKPESWQKANPNYGISVRPKYLKAQAAEAVAKPSTWNSFVRYHCNRRVQSHSPAYPEELWKLGRIKGLPRIRKHGEQVFLGMDLGRSNDWCAVSSVWPIEWKGRWRFRVKTKCWACAGPHSKIDYTREPFRGWIKKGLLSYQAGNEVVDVAEVKDYIRDLAANHSVRSLAYDKTYAHETAIELYNEAGIPLLDFYQSHAKYTEPIRSFETALRAGDVEHYGETMLQWQAFNARFDENVKGQVMIVKKSHRQRKVDSIVAMLMAYNEAIYYGKQNLGSALIT